MRIDENNEAGVARHRFRGAESEKILCHCESEKRSNYSPSDGETDSNPPMENDRSR